MPNGIITSYTISYVTDSSNESIDVDYNGEEVGSDKETFCITKQLCAYL